MAYATARQQGADILIVCEPNKKRVSDSRWIKDSKVSVALLLLNRGLAVLDHSEGEGYVVLRLRAFSVVCCYISPNISMTDYQRAVDNLMELVQHGETVVLGDINAKSPMWGAPLVDNRGAYWTEWISTKNLVVHNTGNKPTFVRGDTNSHIDVTMSTNTMAKQVRNWVVLEQESLTEHKYIYFEVGRPGTGRRRIGTTKKTNWNAFRDTMQIMARSNKQVSLDEGIKLIQQAHKNCTETGRPEIATLYWWNETVANKREDCNRLRRALTRASRTRNTRGEAYLAHRTAYKTAKKELAKEIKAAKRQAWEGLCRDLDSNIWGDAYQIVAKRLNTLTPYELNPEKKFEIARALFSQTKEGWQGGSTVGAAEAFTSDEIRIAAASIKCGRAPGLDSIPPEAIKLVAEDSPEWLLGFFNNLLETQTFPDRWKVARLVLLLKGDKPPNLPSSYRPLCMLSSMSKLFETLIKNRLCKEIDERGGLHENQYGFRKNRSTVQAIEAVMDTTMEFNCRWCALVTIDVKNAFNSASHPLIMRELSRRGISKYLSNLISSYLKARKIEIDSHHLVEVRVGVPQGSVLGPVLWNILYDGVLRLDLTADARTIGFADDLALIVGARDENALMTNVNKCLEEIRYWMAAHELTLAPDKSEAVLMRGGRSREHVSFDLGGVAIIPKKAIRYLGVIINDRGTFGQHIEAATRRADSRLAQLARLMPNIGGPSSGKRAVLCSVLHNIVLYGAPVWADALGTEKHRLLLIRTQRNALLRVASAFRTASANALQVVNGVLPIDLMAQERSVLHLQSGADGEAERRAVARTTSVEKWQKRWDDNYSNAQWTKRLIPMIKPWLNCKFRRVDYHLTQILTGHGVFRAYAVRFGKDIEAGCIYCGEEDTVEHTAFRCDRWRQERWGVFRELGVHLTPDNLVRQMLSSPRKWDVIHQMFANIMRNKEAEERTRQASST